MEEVTGSGLVVEHRSLNDPPTPLQPPADNPGDPHGLEITTVGTPTAFPQSLIVPSAWDGWPADWNTPLWNGHLEELTEIAWTCIDLNASLLSTMPPYLVGASAGLPADWLNNPDPDLYASWEEFAKQLFWDFQCGEVFVLATAWYANGWPARFHVVPAAYVNAEWVDGFRTYAIGQVDVTPDILHVRYQSTTGDAHGHGPLEAGRARLVAASMLTRYASNMASAGGIPNAVLKHPQQLNAQQAADLQSSWVVARMSTMGLPAVLSGGIEFETLQLDPKSMALVELSQLTESRIAVLLGVPPFLVGLPSGGDSMTYSNVVSLFDYHWRAGLRPKAATVMAALSAWLTPRGTRIEVNRDEYVQPGPYERAQTAEILNRIRDEFGNPVLSVAQIQQAERLTNSIPAPDLSAGVLR